MKLFKITLFILLLGFKALADNYYLNNQTGNDASSGRTEATAWKTLNNLSIHSFKPGDAIFFKAGQTFEGNISWKNIQGTENKTILLSSYGGTDKPWIKGLNTNAAIYMLNPAHIVLQNLEVTNSDGQYGLLLKAENAGELKNITLSHLDVHDVFDEAFEHTNTPKTRGGIVFQVEMGKEPTWWNGITIENCIIHDLGSCGISIGSDYKVNKDPEKEDEDRYPILGVNINHNTIHDIVRDGAIIRQCKGAVMEYNEVYRTGLTSVSNGMWFYDSDSCIIQHNIGHHCKAAQDKDGAPFSLDNHTTNCTIQYNYSHSNEGAGYMLFGHNGTEHNNIIRHNISYNDASNIVSDGVGSIALVSQVKQALVEDNIIIAGPSTICVVGHRDWDGLPLEVVYRKNLFVGNGTAFINRNVLKDGTFIDNFFINIRDLPEELAPDQNRISNYYQQLQQMILKYDSINNYNIEKY